MAAPAEPPAAAAAPSTALAAVPAAPGSGAAAGGDPFLAVCRWWDRECAGYLRAEDVEEVLLYTTDFLSRARPGPPCEGVSGPRLTLWRGRMSVGVWDAVCIPCAPRSFVALQHSTVVEDGQQW